MSVASILIATSVIGGVISGFTDAKTGNTLRKSICAVNEATASVTAAYQNLLLQQEGDISTLQSELEDSIDQLASEKETLKVLRENYAKSRNQMVIASICFVVTIIISFLFKKFGVFDMIYEAIFGKQK